MERDARGYGVYDVFTYIPQGQVNISTTYPGVIRAFHRHANQSDFWKVVSGEIEVCLYRSERGEDVYTNREYASRIMKWFPNEDHRKVMYMDEHSPLLIIPPGVWHGFRVLGNQNAKLLYYVTNKYNPKSPDEERVPWDTFYDWKTVYK